VTHASQSNLGHDPCVLAVNIFIPSWWEKVACEEVNAYASSHSSEDDAALKGEKEETVANSESMQLGAGNQTSVEV